MKKEKKNACRDGVHSKYYVRRETCNRGTEA